MQIKPDQFRELRLTPGRLLGLYGDWNAESIWSHNNLIKAVLKTYLVVERRHSWELQGVVWDAAVLASLPEPLSTQSIEPVEDCTVHQLLLLHRYMDTPWDDNCTVHVYGVRVGEALGEEPLALIDWLPKTVWLSAAATMTVEDNPEPSWLAQVLQGRSDK